VCGGVVVRRGWSRDFVNKVRSEGAPRNDECRTRRGHLDDPGAAKNLRRTLPASAGNEAQPLFEPDGNLSEPSHMRKRHHRQRKEGSRGGALPLAPTHFLAKLPIDPATRDTCSNVRAGQAGVVIRCSTRRVSLNCAQSKLAHAPRGGDGRDTIELRRCAPRGRSNLSKRKVQQARSRDRANTVGSHHGHNLALALAEVGH
jgi:hypothetical protein